MGHNFEVSNVAPDGNAVLRLRQCKEPECRSMFSVCSTCDRGQCYCCMACRANARRRQRKAANGRYQQTESGKGAHRRCQGRYREKATPRPVTDQTTASVTTSTPGEPPSARQCSVCRRQSRWIDPFPMLPPWWRGRQRVQKKLRF